MEPEETPEEAARRETREETGFDVTLRPDSESVLKYEFRWGDRTFLCETRFFVGDLVDRPAQPITDPIVQGVRWVDWTALQSALAFHPALRDHLLPRYRNLLPK